MAETLKVFALMALMIWTLVGFALMRWLSDQRR